jgi:hypothetical protein
MTEVREVTGTAFVVAEFRARENDEPHPPYLDPVVHIFLDDRTKKAAAAIRADFPAGEKMPRLRTRYFDDRLDEQITQGCRQVVILGSGLDTRPVRKRADGVAYFEIDDANTLSLKQARYAANGIDAPVTFIPSNYVAAGVLLEQRLRRKPAELLHLGRQYDVSDPPNRHESPGRPERARAPVRHLVRLYGRGGGGTDDR